MHNIDSKIAGWCNALAKELGHACFISPELWEHLQPRTPREMWAAQQAASIIPLRGDPPCGIPAWKLSDTGDRLSHVSLTGRISIEWRYPGRLSVDLNTRGAPLEGQPGVYESMPYFKFYFDGEWVSFHREDLLTPHRICELKWVAGPIPEAFDRAPKDIRGWYIDRQRLRGAGDDPVICPACGAEGADIAAPPAWADAAWAIVAQGHGQNCPWVATRGQSE